MDKIKNKNIFQSYISFPKVLIVVAFLIILGSVFAYGFIIASYEIFPYEELRDVKRLIIPQQLCKFNAEDFPHIYQTNVTSLIKIDSSEDIIQKRQNMMEYIWKGNGISDLIPIKIEKNITDVRFDMKDIEQIDKLTVEMDYGFKSIAYLFFPKSLMDSENIQKNNSLVIYHQGHKGGFADEGKKTIEELLKNNYAVLAFSMPLIGQNNQPMVDIPNRGVFHFWSHSSFHFLDNSNFSSLKYYFEPIMKSLNYVDKNYSFEKYHMVGLSGGGWTTMVYSAIDPRINHSYAVSGGYPGYLQQMSKSVEYERTASGIESIVNYPEMYVMSSFGEHRKSMHISIEWDTGYRCGNFAQTYDKPVKEMVKQLGSGVFKSYLDSSIIGHEISDKSLSIILEELNLD